MKLMYAPQSPFSRKVRAASIELGMDGDIELVYAEVIPGKPNREYGDGFNPLRKIPALVLADGAVIHDSTVICEYLDSLAGGGKLMPAAGEARWLTLTRHSLGQGMCEAAILLRYETWHRPQTLHWPDWTDDQWDRIYSGLDWWEANAHHLEGPVDIAHLALGSALGYVDFRWLEAGWRDGRPRVAAWYEQISQRESFARTAPENPPEESI